MSSIIAYALYEELNEEDLGLLISFIGMISSDLAILIVKKGLDKASTNEVIDTIVEDISQEVVESSLVRKNKNNKTKKIKKIKKVKKNNNNKLRQI